MENALKVLLVDDEPDILKLLALAFERRGIPIVTASSGFEAFDKVVEDPTISVVVSDIRMPNGTGMELLAKLKERNARIPVLMFMTGYSVESVVDALDLGAVAMFHKPFDRKQLVDTVVESMEPIQSLWARNVSVSPEATFELNVEVPSLDQLGANEDVQFGNGGMFVAMTSHFPREGEIAKFTIHSKVSTETPITGIGLVRWVRPASDQDHKLLSGCGIKFLHVDQQHIDRIIACLDRTHTKSYVPRGHFK